MGEQAAPHRDGAGRVGAARSGAAGRDEALAIPALTARSAWPMPQKLSEKVGTTFRPTRFAQRQFAEGTSRYHCRAAGICIAAW